MPENNNVPEQPKRRIPWGTIISAVLIIGLVCFGFLSPYLFNNTNVEVFDKIDFGSKILLNENAYIVAISTKSNSDITYVNGYYYEFTTNSKISDKARQFTVTFTRNEMSVANPYYNTDAAYPLDFTNVDNPAVTTKSADTSLDKIQLSQRLEDEVRYSKTASHLWTKMTNIKPDQMGSGNDSSLYETTIWDTFLSFLPYIIFGIAAFIIFMIVLSRLSKVAGKSNDQAMSFNNSRARRVTKSNVRFDQVAGCDEEKAELVEVVEYLKNPRKFTDFGAKLPKGILLVGPPGTGKTLLAKATAGEAGVPFYSISGSDFVEMFVGVGAGRVRDMFKKAKQTAPCIVFIDEIDAVGRQRGAGLGGGNDEREQTLNQLLVEMDGFADNSGIVIIAATNREDVLDPALLRAGRFDRQITVNLPDRAGREAIFHVHARNKTFAADVDFAQVSKRTVGFSGADIENILNEAAILAVRQQKQAIDMSDIDEAIDRRISGPAKKSKGMSEKERRTVAFHEAGHAIIGLKLPHSDKVQKITIVPRGRTGGHVLMTPEDDRFLLTKKELIARIVGYLGGRSSEEVFFDDISSGAQNDIEVATRIARLMVTELGMSDLGPIQYEKDSGSVFLGRDYGNRQKTFSGNIANEIDKEVRRLIEEAHKEAIRIITKYKKEVTLIAETLLDKETITAEEIDYLLKNGQLPKPVNNKVIVTTEPLEGADPTVELPVIVKDDVKIIENTPEEPKPVKKAAPKKSASTAKKSTGAKTTGAKKSSAGKTSTTKKSNSATKTTTKNPTKKD